MRKAVYLMVVALSIRKLDVVLNITFMFSFGRQFIRNNKLIICDFNAAMNMRNVLVMPWSY